MADRSNVTENREDISRFVVHLTRDDTKTWGKEAGGASGRDNLETILKEKRVGAFRPHCLHAAALKEHDKRIEAKFWVAWFTEVPLNQLNLLTQKIVGIEYQREPYGVVFSRKTLINYGAQPAIYVNSYANNAHIREAVNQIYRIAEESGFKDPIFRVLPYLNVMCEKYDFTWEREWRVVGDFNFTTGELVCVVLPIDDDHDLKHSLAKQGIAVISPVWTYEQIVAELSRQQRKTKAAMTINTTSSSAKS